MIERYSRPEMKEVWSSQEKYNIWFNIEAFACEAMAELGKIPKESVKNIWNKGKVNSHKIDEIEKIYFFSTRMSINILENKYYNLISFLYEKMKIILFTRNIRFKKSCITFFNHTLKKTVIIRKNYQEIYA